MCCCSLEKKNVHVNCIDNSYTRCRRYVSVGKNICNLTFFEKKIQAKQTGKEFFMSLFFGDGKNLHTISPHGVDIHNKEI